MPVRAIIIMFVFAVVFAVFYRDQIYKWFKESVCKTRTEEEKPDDESEEEKENKD